MNKEQLLSFDKDIKQRAEEVCDFVRERKSVLYRKLQELDSFDYYLIDEEENEIRFVSQYCSEVPDDVSVCPIEYISEDNWQELIIRDEEIETERQTRLDEYNNKLKEKRELQLYLELQRKFKDR